MMPPWSPMILATRAKPSPVPDGLVVTKGSNRCGMRSVGHAGAVVFHGDLERQADPRLAARHRETHARAEGGGERDLAVGPLLADRLGGVLDEVEEHLDQLVAAAGHGRQRGIVILDDLDLAGEAGGARSASRDRARREC